VLRAAFCHWVSLLFSAYVVYVVSIKSKEKYVVDGSCTNTPKTTATIRQKGPKGGPSLNSEEGPPVVSHRNYGLPEA